MKSKKIVMLMSLIIRFCSCHVNAGYEEAATMNHKNEAPEEHSTRNESAGRGVYEEVPESEKFEAKKEQSVDENPETKSAESHDVKNEGDVTTSLKLDEPSEQEGNAVDSGKDAVQDKALMQKMYEYVKSIFDQIGIALKDVMSSWSKMSSKQVDKLASDIDAITASASRFVEPEAEGDVFLNASKKASQDIKSLSVLDEKIENMPEGPDKVQMQESIDTALAIVVNDIANLVYFKPKSVDISPVLADLPKEVQDAVNEMVDWKSQEAAKKATYNSQQPGIFENFSKEQQKPADEIVSGYKNKLQSDKAIAAQKKVEAKMKEKSNQTLDQELATATLKSTPTQSQRLFKQADMQTDFSAVTTNASGAGDVFVKSDQSQVKVANESTKSAPNFLDDVVAKGQSGLKPVVKSVERPVAQSDAVKQIAARRTNIKSDDVEKLDMEDELFNENLPSPKTVSKKTGSQSSSSVSSKSSSQSQSLPSSPRGVDVSQVESGFNTGLLKKAEKTKTVSLVEEEEPDTAPEEWE